MDQLFVFLKLYKPSLFKYKNPRKGKKAKECSYLKRCCNLKDYHRNM